MPGADRLHIELRRVVVAGDGQLAEGGDVVAARGFFIGLTEPVTREMREFSERSVAAARATQEVIDQARGVLMAVYEIDADAAWALLRWASQNTNTKLRDMAGELVRSVSAGEGERALRGRLERILSLPEEPRTQHTLRRRRE